ncbi:hypothetical protein PR003_g23970 [Phytophthora rubi]|nr:hypothetical protein PR003_g23970 [Phytophthora rubi]
MKGIALNTTYTCSTCPELPRVFPVAATDNRGVVFFVNASQKWGLEFFVNGGNAQDYTSQFAPGGRYAALEVDDYVVVDLRGNATGTVSDDVALKEKLVSVFFKLGDFSRCQCAFGMDETQHDIDLS